MQVFAKDLMSQQYGVIHQNASVKEAVEQILKGDTRPTGHKNVSLMVVDDNNNLVGTISMYYILYFLRPSYLLYGIDSSEVSVRAEVEEFIGQVQGKKVRDIMNTDGITAHPDDPMMLVLDRMMRNRLRRLPVVKEGEMLGVIYMTDIFHYLFAPKER